VLLEAVREPVKVPLYRGYRCLQGPLSVNVGRVSVVEAMNMSVEAVRRLIKAVRVLMEVVGVPKEAVRVQHSHSLCNTLTTVRKFYYNPREYLYTAEALIVLIEAVRCFRGRERARRGP
jgi:hypothetical protein